MAQRQPSEASVQKIKRYVEHYRAKSGTVGHPDECITDAVITGLAANFLRFVASNRRLFSVRAMIRDFRKLVANWKGEVSAAVTVAEKLSDRHLDALKDALKQVTGGKAVDLNVKVDPAIIGGLTVQLGSRMVDASLRTKLNAIKHAMKEAG